MRRLVYNRRAESACSHSYENRSQVRPDLVQRRRNVCAGDRCGEIPRIPALVRPRRRCSTDAGGMMAEVGMSFGGMRQTFTTRNEHVAGSQGDDAAGGRAVFQPRRAAGTSPLGRRQPARLQGRTRACSYGLATPRWPRWWARCSTRSRATWSMPSSSAPSRSTGDGSGSPLYSPAPREVHEWELTCPKGATVRAGAGGMRLGSSFPGLTGAAEVGIWGRARARRTVA